MEWHKESWVPLKMIKLMHSAGNYTAWNSRGKHKAFPSQISIFCLSSTRSLSSIPFCFSSSCSSFAVTRRPPLSSFSPRTDNSTSDGFSLHHASLHYLLFSKHLWGWEGPGYVKEILKISISTCWEVSTVNKYVLKAADPHPHPHVCLRQETRGQHVGGQIFGERHIHSRNDCDLMNSCHAYQVGYSDHWKNLCFLVFVPSCTSFLQHHGQLPHWILLQCSAPQTAPWLHEAQSGWHSTQKGVWEPLGASLV